MNSSESKASMKLDAFRRSSAVHGLTLALTLGAVTLTKAQPEITTQPSDRFLLPAQTTTSFFVAGSGALPRAFQWFFNGETLAGATNSILRVTNALSGQGDYFAVVSDASGSVTSTVARLKVFSPAPHGFSGIAANADGAALLDLQGETTPAFGRYFDLYPLEVSSNLLNWVPLVTLQRTNDALIPLAFLDTNGPSFDRRFYRLPTNLFPTLLAPPTGRV